MKILSAFIAVATLAGLVPASAATDPSQVAVSVARWLEKGHYSRAKLDDAMSRKLLQTYLRALDYNRLYFTQKDIDEFEALYADSLDDAIFSGDLEHARAIFARYRERVRDRIAKNKTLVAKDFNFDSNREVRMNRKDVPWPATDAEADALWRDIVEAELLRETLARSEDSSKTAQGPVKTKTPQETVTRRYDQVLRNVNEMEDADVVDLFLTSLAQSYDPHSQYLSPSEMENFQISMRLSLVGVGAVLRSEDGYAKVMEVVPGGPADLDGRLKVGDRISAVAQGDGEFEDVVDMKLDKVVEKIRGKKGTQVRLLVLPADATDPAQTKVVDIVRDEVKLKDQEAKAELLKLKNPDGKTSKIGWITLPSFYAEMGGRPGGKPKSTTADVSALISRLKREGMQGLVIDLRRDGGGSLEEAINLTGLFIPRGPVVQSKDSNGKITVSQDSNPGVAYDGPLIVLMNRLSASASEIFAAALQDYGRAVIVGDERSFGKGTVQTVLDLGRLTMPFSLSSGDSGALKLTIQKFYRVRGGSTQLNGVASDIVLPSLTDNPEIGESSLDNSLPYDEVAPVKIADSMAATPLFLEELAERSATRVARDPEFAYVTEDAARLKDKIETNTVSLNLKARKAEIAADKKRKEDRKLARAKQGDALNVAAFEITLDDVDSPTLKPVAYNRKRDKSMEADEETALEDEKSEEVQPDPIRDEALRIANDLVELSASPRTARAGGDNNPGIR